MISTSDFRHQCALLGVTRDTIDSKIIIVPEPKFWRARDISDVDWPGMVKYVLRQLEEQEIPCKLLDNDDNIEYRAFEVDTISALAFISCEIVKTVGVTLMLNWISNSLGWSSTQHYSIPITVEIERPDGSTKRLTATTNTVGEAEQLIRSITDEH